MYVCSISMRSCFAGSLFVINCVQPPSLPAARRAHISVQYYCLYLFRGWVWGLRSAQVAQRTLTALRTSKTRGKMRPARFAAGGRKPVRQQHQAAPQQRTRPTTTTGERNQRITRPPDTTAISLQASSMESDGSAAVEPHDAPT